MSISDRDQCGTRSMALCRVLCLVLFVSLSAESLYIFPPIHLQALATGGLKAYMQDTCGIDGFGFQIKRTNETAWKTGNGTKEEIFWTFWDRGRQAKVGDVFDFSARVWYEGIPYTYPSNKWTVPELVEEFTDPPHAEMEDNCIQTTTEQSKKKIKEESENTETTREPKKIKGEEQDLLKTVPLSGMCTWVDPPKANSTREEILEKQLAMLQCEMSAFLERTSKLTSELNKELLDLKKLNYAAVARMQRLESLIRTIPKSIPYPYV